VYVHSAAAQRAIANAPAQEFLAAVFEDQPKAFQSLNFWFGSGQPMHKDSAYVKIDNNPTAFAATWLALEDLSPGSGELEYYAGSHHAPPFLFGGEDKWMEAYPQDHDRFLASLHADAEKYHHQRHAFLARAGDLLIWHADLAHGGSPVVNRVTRKSLVTHFTPASAAPFYYRNGKHREKDVNAFTFCSQYGNVR
jgi:ectoine hydroxylase-related dioxygenase (phytanoyl-CoA dioxygenase family)